MLESDLKTLVLIDGQSVYFSTLKLGAPALNYKKLREYFMSNTKLMNLFYYNVVPKGERTSLRKVIDYLSHNGYVCRTPSTVFRMGDDGKERSTIRVRDLITEAMETLCYSSSPVEQVVLIGHSPIYARGLESLQLAGKRTVLIGTSKSDPPKVQPNLIAVAKNFIELWDLPVWYGVD